MSLAAISKRQLNRLLNNPSAFGTSETDEAIKHYFCSLNTPKSLAASLLYQYGEHKQLLELDVDPLHYNDPDLFHRDYMAISFLSKADFLTLDYDKRARAIEKFQKMEAQCSRTNARFLSYSDLEKSEYATLLFVMRRKIDMILGEFCAEEMFEKASWGPGSSTRIKGCDVSPARKFQSEIGITRSLYSLVSSSLPEAYPHWFSRERLGDSSFPFEEGNTVTTVPKNSKIDRVIAIEPGINLWFQKGIGKMLRSRLLKWNVNLNDQSVNQILSKRGSQSGALATVDFSSASDTIAFRLVEYLLPTRWFSVLNASRSSSGSIDGSTFVWEKFSSMGNGFTFELESLIFFAAALAVAEVQGVNPSEISVYGDDVIIPSSIFISYGNFCDFLGFTVNSEKSFSSGSFRESCGAHWFAGIDVKPLFLKERLNHVSDVQKLANSIRRIAHRRNNFYGCDRRFLHCWRYLSDRIPGALRRLKIPEGFGDGGLLSNFDEACPSRLKHQLEGFRTLHASEIGKKIKAEHHGLLLAQLHAVENGAGTTLRPDVVIPRKFSQLFGGLSIREQRNSVTLRNRTSWNVSNLDVTSWYDLGPWI